MTRIGAADTVLRLLRARLEAEARTRKAASTRTAPLDGQARLEALAALGQLSPRSFRRALVRGLLAERFGEELAGEPAFESVVGEVLSLIESNPETSDLLDRAGGALRAEP